MPIQKIEGHPNLIRDISSQAILNTDQYALEAYRKKKEESYRISHIEKEIENMKDMIGEIYSMMKTISK